MIKNNNMNGKIKGKSIWNFVMALDWSLDNVEDRLEHVRKILGEYKIGDVNFYHEFFEEVFNQDNPHSKVKLILSTDDARYEESNIAKALEVIESYILCSRDEIEERKKNKTKYKIYNSNELLKRFEQERNLMYKLSTVNSDKSNNYDKDDSRKDKDNDGNVFEIFQLPKNYKKVKDIVIEKKDFKRFPILNDYQQSINHMKEKLKELMEIDENKLNEEDLRDLRSRKKMIMKNLKLLKLDMLDAKKQLEMPIIWKAPLKDNGGADYDMLDMFDKNVVKELLRVHKQIDLQDELSCILVDLENLIKKVNFTKRQREVLEMWSKGLSASAIARELNVKPQTIAASLDSVIALIVKQYEKDYEDWYYLNIRKGQYKKCKICNKNKLINNFDIKKDNKDGHKNICKECQKEKR